MIDRLCPKCEKRFKLLEELVITQEYLLPGYNEQQLMDELWKVMSDSGMGWPHIQSEKSVAYIRPLPDKSKEYFGKLKRLTDSALIELRVAVFESLEEGIIIEVMYIPALYRKITQTSQKTITLDALSACRLEGRMILKTVFVSGLGAKELGQESDFQTEKILEKLTDYELASVTETDRKHIHNHLQHALDSFRDKRYSDCITRINNICEILILALFQKRKTDLDREERSIEKESKRESHSSRLGKLKVKILGDRLWHDLCAIHLRRRESDSVHGLGKPMRQSDAILAICAFQRIVYDIEERMKTADKA